MHRLHEEQQGFTGRYSTAAQRRELHRDYCNPTDAEKVFCNICGCQCGPHLKSVIDHYFVKRIGGQIIYYWRRRRICWICNAKFLEMIRRLGHTIVPTSLDLGCYPLDVKGWYAVAPRADIPPSRTSAVRAASERYFDDAYVFPRISDAAAATRRSRSWRRLSPRRAAASSTSSSVSMGSRGRLLWRHNPSTVRVLTPPRPLTSGFEG